MKIDTIYENYFNHATAKTIGKTQKAVKDYLRNKLTHKKHKSKENRKLTTFPERNILREASRSNVSASKFSAFLKLPVGERRGQKTLTCFDLYRYTKVNKAPLIKLCL